jgi:hypothetical protein
MFLVIQVYTVDEDTNLLLLVVMVEFMWTSFVKTEKVLGNSERYTSGGARGSKD